MLQQNHPYMFEITAPGKGGNFGNAIDKVLFVLVAPVMAVVGVVVS